MFVRLTSKLANALDGVDVSKVRVGEVLELPDAKAAMLIAEKWAEQVPADKQRATTDSRDP